MAVSRHARVIEFTSNVYCKKQNCPNYNSILYGARVPQSLKTLGSRVMNESTLLKFHENY
jgi:hypothetical protein